MKLVTWIVYTKIIIRFLVWCVPNLIFALRSSHRRCPIKKVFLKFSLRPAAFFKKTLQRRYFPVNFAKFLRAPFLQNTSRRLHLALTFMWLNMLYSYSDKLRQLVPILLFEKHEKHTWRIVTYIITKRNTPPWVFSCLLSCKTIHIQRI